MRDAEGISVPGRPQPAAASENNAWRIKCHRCSAELPFLHPHIIVEYTDDADELICHDCYAELHSDS